MSDREDELEADNARLRDQAGRRDDRERHVIFKKLDEMSLQMSTLSTNFQNHKTETAECLEELKAETKTIKDVVCGIPGKPKDGLSSRMDDCEKDIKDRKESKAWASKTAIGAAIISAIALGKDWLVQAFHK